mgnify:CR=1 FL=1
MTCCGPFVVLCAGRCVFAQQSLTEDGKLKRDGKKVRATAVAPSEPRETAGLYWGYQVRLANSISEVFTFSPYKVRPRGARVMYVSDPRLDFVQGGYDLTVGTSERGNVSVDDVSFSLPAFRCGRWFLALLCLQFLDSQ